MKSSGAQDLDTAVKLIWERLDEKYGTIESVHAAVMEKLEKVPRINAKEFERLYELSDILLEINTLKEKETFKAALSYFDSSL
ncbi:hypothetical protein DPMN_172094 [Dreissena polymorpha]|uniref:Uncharacterized protein n=1 Tax=Dreissena polymorpha TaxID=45954 RepID=A0A9D4E1M0_DREPO|nr:hypothetical protein DPMN_172094 [Dreissena polymorpha]